MLATLSCKQTQLNLKSEEEKKGGKKEKKKPVSHAHFLGFARHLGEVLRVAKKYPNWEAGMSYEMHLLPPGGHFASMQLCGSHDS